MLFYDLQSLDWFKKCTVNLYLNYYKLTLIAFHRWNRCAKKRSKERSAWLSRNCIPLACTPSPWGYIRLSKIMYDHKGTNELTGHPLPITFSKNEIMLRFILCTFDISLTFFESCQSALGTILTLLQVSQPPPHLDSMFMILFISSQPQ